MVPHIPFLIFPLCSIFTSNMVQQEKRYWASVSQSSSVVYFNQRYKLQNFTNLQFFNKEFIECVWDFISIRGKPLDQCLGASPRNMFSPHFSFFWFFVPFYLIYFFHVKKVCLPLKVILGIITTYDGNHMKMTVTLMVLKAFVTLDRHSMQKWWWLLTPSKK